MRLRNFIVVYLMVVMAPVMAAASPQILKTELRAANGTEQLVLYLSEEVDYNYFFLDNPHRLVINIPTIASGANVPLPAGSPGKVIKALRFGQFDANTSRIVADLYGPADAARVFILPAKDNEPLRLVFDIEAEGALAISSANPHKSKRDERGVPVPADKPIGLMQEANKPIVVIDPGHGGQDPGAIGRHGRMEKRVTLEYAKALRTELLKTGRYRVVLTREDDRFILLRERIRLGRSAGGSIFISLHADSAPTAAARGLSVYTLSENASDAEAATLAKQENKSDILSGLDLSEESQDVADILIDLAQRETMNKSSRLAESLVKRADGKVKLLPNPHRFAGFAVLKAPDVPSVLVEIGFLSNREDEKLINSASYRDRFVRGMVRGIDSYFKQDHDR